MASSSSKYDRVTTDPDFTTTKNIGKLICEFIGGLMKITNLKQSKNIEPMIKRLGKHLEELVGTAEGRRLLCSMKQLALRIKNKENFLGMLWRMFHVTGRICTEGSGRFGLFFMGTALLVFLLSTVTGLAEGILAVWFTLAARTFAMQLFTSGSNLMRKGVKETVPNRKTFVNLLNTIACGSGQEHEQVSKEEIQQLEVRFARAKVCFHHDWVLL
ncbi:Hypothetical predicted protein [Paramuricea clavata]|uniref:Uncharacterized protein n=1 Tax=Paramuricea clavata TaxID=317549 RepID=A0A7D9EWV3_PARCT|nr:Hypothetical predicted protein [Paramuricea clavata]